MQPEHAEKRRQLRRVKNMYRQWIRQAEEQTVHGHCQQEIQREALVHVTRFQTFLLNERAANARFGKQVRQTHEQEADRHETVVQRR